MPPTFVRRSHFGAALAAAAFAVSLPQLAVSAEALSPPAQRGQVFVLTNCSRCHSVDKVTESPLKIAPPFRTLHNRYPSKIFRNRLPRASSRAIRRCRRFGSIPDNRRRDRLFENAGAIDPDRSPSFSARISKPRINQRNARTARTVDLRKKPAIHEQPPTLICINAAHGCSCS